MARSKNSKGGRFGKAPAFLQFTAIDRRGTRRRIGGTTILSDPELPDQVRETRGCVHCQRQFYIRPGSGIQRGYCMRCDGLTCGAFKCETTCTPFEQVIEEQERAGRGLKALGKPFYL